MVCNKCEVFGLLPTKTWFQILNGAIILQHHETVKALMESARKGCHLCNLTVAALQEAMNPAKSKPLPLQANVTFVFWRDNTQNPITGDQRNESRIDIYCEKAMDVARTKGKSMPKGELRITQWLINKSPQDFTLPLNDNNTASKQTFDQIISWLDSCNRGHSGCRRMLYKQPSLPTRVIDVGGKHSTTNKLVAVDGRSSGYVALSHRWGAAQPVTTTLKTLNSRTAGINDSELPKTFKDAVTVCRELGFRYLWIDSLCIIQDSTSDWQEQAAVMGDIYRNASLTIAAGSAEDSSVGCFFPRDALKIRPCEIQLFGILCTVERHASFDAEIYGSFDMYHKTPLDTRAWVLQEQILSTRTLNFMDIGVYWQCATVRASEKHPLGLPDIPQATMDYRFRLQTLITGATPSSGHRKAELYGSWYRSVMDFTQRRVTYPKDKLPALSGLARKMAVATGDKYIAGLWDSDLFIGLLWFVNAGMIKGETLRRAQDYRAPSWSWASMENFVDYIHVVPSLDQPEEIDSEGMLKELQIEFDYLDSGEPFGQIRSGRLQARAPVFRVKTTQKQLAKLGDICFEEVSYEANQSPKDALGKHFTVETTQEPVTKRRLITGAFHPDESEWHSTSYWCTPVTSLAKRVKPHLPWGFEVFCFILKPHGQLPNTYTRIGLGKIDDQAIDLLDSKKPTRFTLL